MDKVNKIRKEKKRNRGYHIIWVDRDKEVEECIKAFPEIPKELIYKSDMHRRGVAFAKRAEEPWQRVQHKYETTEGVDVFNWQGRASTVQTPYTCAFNSGTISTLRLSYPETQPYEIDINEEGGFCFKAGEKTVIDEISFRVRRDWYDKKTSSGLPMPSIAISKGWDEALLIPYRHCHYWNTGDECRFCDIEVNNRRQMKLGRGVPTRFSEEDIYEVIREILKTKGSYRHHICATGGTDTRIGNDVDFWVSYKKAYDRAINDSGHPPMMPFCQLAPPDEEGIIRLKEAGYYVIGFNIEVFPEWQWPLIIPGKDKFVGRKKWLERTLKAVEIFGRGYISSQFVTGLIMAPEPYGRGPDYDVDKAVKETMEGFEWCWEHGVQVTTTPWYVSAGSHLYKIGATPPPLEYYCKMHLAYFEMMKKNIDNPHFNNFGANNARCHRCEPHGFDVDLPRLLLPGYMSKIPDRGLGGQHESVKARQKSISLMS